MESLASFLKETEKRFQPMALSELFGEDEDNDDAETVDHNVESKQADAGDDAPPVAQADCEDVQETVQPADEYDAKTQQLLELVTSEPTMITCPKELVRAVFLTASNFMRASPRLREDVYACLCLCSRDYLGGVDDRTPEESMAVLFKHMRVEMTAQFVARAFDIFEKESDWRRMRTFLSVHNVSFLSEELQNGVMYIPGKEMPTQFLCPIMQTPMRDPVVCADGHTYDRENIQRWFDEGNETSPLTNRSLENCSLVTNFALKSLMDDMCCRYTFRCPGRKPCLDCRYSCIKYAYVYAPTKTVRISGDTLECCISPRQALLREKGGEYGGYLHRLVVIEHPTLTLQLCDCLYEGPVNTDRMIAGCHVLGLGGWVYMKNDVETMALTTTSNNVQDVPAGVDMIEKRVCTCVMIGHRKFRDAFTKANFEGQNMDLWWENSVFDSPMAKASRFA
jgi:hypothetical protein